MGRFSSLPLFWCSFRVLTSRSSPQIPLAGGRRRGWWSAWLVSPLRTRHKAALAAAGLGAVIVRVEPLFQAIKFAGIVYLLLLAVQAFRSTCRGLLLAAIRRG